MPVRTAIERRERRVRKQRKWDVRWAEQNDYNRWCALQTRKQRWMWASSECQPSFW